MATERQTAFAGGMVDSVDPGSPDMPANACAYLENVEVRDGLARTRRGSVVLSDWLATGTVYGVGSWVVNRSGEDIHQVIVARDGYVYLVKPPLPPVLLATPGSETVTYPVRFVVGGNSMLMLRGETRRPWRWSGNVWDAWTEVADPTDGDAWCLRFSGSAAYIDVDTVLAYAPLLAAVAGELYARLYLDAVGASQRTVVSLADQDANTYLSLAITATGRAEASLCVAGTVKWTVTTDAAVYVGSWVEVQLVHDGTDAELLVNGVAPAQTFGVSTDKTVWVAGLGLGAVTHPRARVGSVNTNGAGEASLFVGVLGGVDVYAGTGSSRGLVARWLMTEGSGSQAGDSSGLSYDGTIVGAEWEQDPTAAEAGDPMPWAGRGAYAYGRTWLVTDEDTLSASDLLSDAFDLTLHRWDIEQGEGGRLVALLPFGEGALVCGKSGAVMLLAGANGDLEAATMTLIPIDPRHGVVGPDAMVQVGRDVWWMSRDGVRSAAMTEQNKMQAVDVPLSAPVGTVVARINWRVGDGIRGAVFGDYVLWSVPLDGSATNNALLAYDLDRKAWAGVWTGVAAQWLFDGVAPERAPWLVAVTATGYLHRLLDGLYWDGYQAGQRPCVKAGKSKTVTVTEPAAGDWALTMLAGGTLSVRVRVRTMPSTQCEALRIWLTSTQYVALSVAPTAGGASTARLTATWVSGGVVQWSVHAEDQYLHTGQWHTVAVLQDAVSPTLWVDGLAATNHVSVSLTPGRWFSYWVGTALVAAMTIGSAQTGDTGDVDVEAVRVSDGNSPHLLGGMMHTGTVFTWAALSGGAVMTAGVYSGATDLLPATPAAIPVCLLSRGFAFGDTGAEKAVGAITVDVSHRGPSVTLTTVVPGRPGAGAVGVAAQVYSNTVYDVAGLAAWNGYDLATYENPHRQNYAPLALPVLAASASVLPTAGVLLDMEARHTLQLYGGVQAEAVQVQVDNAAGTVAVRELALAAAVLPWPRKGA